MKRHELEHVIRAAGREKDRRFVEAMLRHSLVDKVGIQRLTEEELAPSLRAEVLNRLSLLG